MSENQGLCQKALAAAGRCNMIQQGDRIAAGVSGGADSVALLDFLCQIRESYPCELLVCHLNHCLRGEESDRDQEFVRSLAARYGLEFCLERADAAAWASAHGCSVEEAGRQLRYAFFARCAGEGGKIATAHTLSDSMETVLLNLARGTGVRGLRGIPPVRGRIIRPLITCTREEVEEYCRERGLAYVTDSTNLSPDYSRNRIRLKVIPELLALNPNLPGAMAGLMERMDAQWRMTGDLAREARERLALPGGGQDRQGFSPSPQSGDARATTAPTKKSLDRAGFLKLPAPVGEAILQGMLEEEGLPQSARMVSLMEEAARRGRGGVQLGEGLTFRVRRDRLELLRALPREEYREAAVELDRLPLPAFFPLGGGKGIKILPFPPKSGDSTEKINKSALKNVLDCGRIKGTVILRRKRDGDRMAPAWRKAGSRSVKKLCQEAGLPPEGRAGLLVAEDGDGVVWAEGFGADRRCAPGENTRRAVVFEVVEDVTNGREP